MYIANKLKENSISEYLLYMWQVEDVIRAYDLDIDRIANEYIPRFQLDDEHTAELRGWYESLIQMMREEGTELLGHLQINKNIILMLTDLHLQVLKSPKHPFYSAQYYKALPFIVELRQRGNADSREEKGEIENCFDALYGILLLRIQSKNVSPETLAAIDNISKLIGMLSDYYKKDKAGELEL